MNKLTSIKLRKPDGTYSDEILIQVLAENVKYDEDNTIKDIIDNSNSQILNLSNIIDNLKIGADSTQYSSVREAINSQINSLQTQINSFDKNQIENIKNKKDKYNKPFRIIAISDIHYSNQIFYNRRASQRMDIMIKALIKEHNKKPIDFLLILGDLSSDNLYVNYNPPTNNCKKLYEDYLYKLPFPVLTLPGNHDVYKNEEWVQITGTPRQYSFLFQDFIFLMLDNWNPQLGSTAEAYKSTDYDYINSMLNLYPDKKFILCSHYFQPSNDDSNILNLINDDKILFLMAGHSHTHEIRSYGNKKILMTGHFSVALENGSGISEYDDSNINTHYGFQSIEMTQNGITSQYIKPQTFYYLNNNSIVNYIYTTENRILLSNFSNFQEMTDFSMDGKSNNEIKTNLINKTYTLSAGLPIRKNSDLNNFIELGVYYSYDAENSNTLLNCPYNQGGFKLIVEHINGDPAQREDTRHKIQKIITSDLNNYEFFRKYNPGSNTFSNWEMILTKTSFQSLSPFATPQMYGAKADGITDDSAAIQAAINSGFNVIIPAGTYKITTTIVINEKINFCFDASGATINYTGDSYAFLLQRTQFSTLKFGKIVSTNGGCIKLFTERESNEGVHRYDYLTYCYIYFEYLSALTDCIYANSENLGWINENRFFGGRMASGVNGFRYYHNSENGSSHNLFYNIGVEGVTYGFNLSLGPRAINPSTSGKNPYFVDYEFYGMRTGEVKTTEGQKIFAISGKCERFLISGGYDIPNEACIFNPDVNDWTIVTPKSFKIVKNGKLMEIDQLELAQASAHQSIANGTDLETLTDLGTYTCNSTSIAKTLINCPVQTAFNMIIKNLVPNKAYTGNNRYYVREIYPINTTGAFFRQVITSANNGESFTYNSWYSFSGTAVTTA